MVTSQIKIRNFFLVFVFLIPLCVLKAQEVELTDYYYQQLEKREFTLAEEETLIDSLLLLKNMKIDTMKLVDIYSDFIKAEGLTQLKKIISYTDKIENLALGLNDFSSEVFKKNYRNRIIFLYRDQQFYKALKAGNNYLERYQENDEFTGKVYRTIGNAYSGLGDFQKAIVNYDESIYVSKSFKNDKELIRAYICKLETLVGLYDPSYSSQILKIEAELKRLKETNEISYTNELVLSLNLGVYFDSQNKYDRAITEYKKAYSLSEENEDTLYMAGSLINLGSIHEENNQLSKSKEYLYQAKIFSGSDFFLNSSISNNLADIYQKENNHQKALIHYQKAIVQALQSKEIDYQTLPNIKDIELSPNKLDILGYLIDKANGWVSYYDAEQDPKYLQKALETFMLADQLIDIIYVESREDLSKLFWRKKGATFYPKAVEVCYRLKQPEKAFFFMEKNKAMLLLENMTNETAKRLSKLPENILEREQSLIKKIKKLEAEIQENTENKTIESLKNKVFKYKNENAAFIDSLETEFPKYYNYKRNVNIVTLQNVQSALQTDELVLQYIVGKEKGFVALISPKNIQLKELPKTEILTKTVTQYKEAVSKPYVNNKDKASYEEVAKKLYQQLIPFNTTEIELTKKHITIIPDGILQYIPFEALRTPNNTYLIENTGIHYNYSLSATAQSQQNKMPIFKTFIAIAPTKFKNQQYGALSTSSAELKKLSSIFSANHFQFEKATKRRFTEAYGNYKIVHLSSHGGIDNTIPWMAFYDEKLTLDELYFTKNQSELVVLSACKTSDGELKKGEGVMSLARGFFNAGAKSVVSSLWDINEKASNDIIQEFYKNIIAGDTKSVALQKAKLTYIENNKNTSEASPYYWSALTITGDITPISQNRNVYIYYLFGAFILTGIVLYIQFKRRKQLAA